MFIDFLSVTFTTPIFELVCVVFFIYNCKECIE